MLQERVQHGVMPELVELARIPGVKVFRARQLYNAGLRTVRDVAGSTASSLEQIISKGKHTCVPESDLDETGMQIHTTYSRERDLGDTLGFYRHAITSKPQRLKARPQTG